MEPDIPTPRGLERQPVVLGIVPSHQDGEAVRGHIPQKIRRLLLFVLRFIILQVSLTLQLGADLRQRGLALGRLHLVLHRSQILRLRVAFRDQLRQHAGGRLFFLVFLKILLGIGAGRKAHIQRDRHFLTVIVIRQRHVFRAALDGPQIGTQKLTVNAQFLRGRTLRLFLPAGGGFAHGTLVQIVHGLCQIAALLTQALRLVLGCVVALQQFRIAAVFHKIRPAVLRQRQKAEFHRAPVHHNRHRRAAVRVSRLNKGHRLQQSRLFLLRHPAGGHVPPAESAVRGFAANHRAHAARCLDECLRYGQFFLRHRRHDARRADAQKRRLLRLGRQRVSKARQKLPNLAVLKVHAFERVDDLPLRRRVCRVFRLHQHQVGIPAHQLGRHRVHHDVAHFVGALEVKKQNALVRQRAHLQQPSAREMLAQQHAKRGRRLRILKRLFCQARAGRAAAGRKEQARIVRARAQIEYDLVPGRLEYFIDPRVRQCGGQLFCAQRKGSGV